MVDLVERLRTYRPANEWGDGVEHTICNEAADEIERLRAAMGAEGQQFMQALVDEASAEIQKRKAAEAELTRLRSECVDGLDALSDIDDFWEASPYPGNRKHLTPAEQISSLVCELNAALDQVAALKSSGGDHG